ncbi:MAG: tyrosine-type recombinase/integrase, partial [Polyangiaceae bacterium]|nr:tyrosine-type recombinase/integrase [Polyangiaceae bacterium]
MARRGMVLDIHDYNEQTAGAEKQVRESEISARNKQLIFGYRDACLLKGTCGRVRLIRVLGFLLLAARTIKKDFDTLTRADVEAFLTALLSRNPPYSPETMGTYKAITKSFLTWVVMPNDFPTRSPPALVSWITCHVRRRYKKRLERKDLLTPEDVEKLLSVCHNTRDKAMIALLWETGCRVSEIGNLQLKHVTKMEH